MFKITKTVTDNNTFYNIEKYNENGFLIEKYVYFTFEELKDAIFEGKVNGLVYISQIVDSPVATQYYYEKFGEVLWYHYYNNFTAHISFIPVNTTYNCYIIKDRVDNVGMLFPSFNALSEYFIYAIAYHNWCRQEMDIVFVNNL